MNALKIKILLILIIIFSFSLYFTQRCARSSSLGGSGKKVPTYLVNSLILISGMFRNNSYCQINYKFLNNMFVTFENWAESLPKAKIEDNLIETILI